MVEAILLSAIREWKINANKINIKGRKETNVRELKQILSFIKSDYFIKLTNAACPQKEIIDKLLTTIKVKKVKDELKKYCSYIK